MLIRICALACGQDNPDGDISGFEIPYYLLSD